MTTVVIYNEFKSNNVKLSGGERDDETVEVLPGVTRKFELVDGQSITIGGDVPETEREKTRGPTISEFVAAGYDANNYPPGGYDAVSSQEEIDAAITAQGKRTAPTGLNAEQLPGTFTPVPGKEPWDVDAGDTMFTPPPKPSFAEDPRNDEQKAKDAERAEVEKKQVANADAANAGKVATPEGYQAPFPGTAPGAIAPIPKEDQKPPEEPTKHELLPGQPEPVLTASTEPLPGIATLNAAENRIPEPTHTLTTEQVAAIRKDGPHEAG